MLELLVGLGGKFDDNDDYDLAYPAGTPFKGVVRSRQFITGSELSSRIGLAAGLLLNDRAGWLHFIEDNGYEIYIAKKPIRCKVHWTDINNAQSGKVIEIGGRRFTVEFMTGAKTDPADVANTSAGGQWNRYMYNVYGGPSKDSLPGREHWGNYTAPMLGMVETGGEVNEPGSGTYTKEFATGTGDGYINRGRYPQGGVPPIAAFWYSRQQDINSAAGSAMGWRPMLVLEGTTPPVAITPFKGEVAQSALITAADLATAVGLTAGTVTNAGAPWLMIVENGKTYYVAKQAFRHTVTKEQLEAANIVNGSKTIVIGGKTYKVRLLTGRSANPSNTVAGEWLRWFTALTDGTWAYYTAAQLITGTGTANNGQLALVQEDDTRGRGANGYPGIFGAWYQNPNVTNAGYGWRPVLELVE